jgi:hypothetical protein
MTTSKASISVKIHASSNEIYLSKQQEVVDVIMKDIESLEVKLGYLGVSTDISFETIIMHKHSISEASKIPCMISTTSTTERILRDDEQKSLSIACRELSNKTKFNCEEQNNLLSPIHQKHATNSVNPQHYSYDSTKMFDSSSVDDSMELLPPDYSSSITVKFSPETKETKTDRNVNDSADPPLFLANEDLINIESEDDIYALSYKDLRKRCKERGLNQGGTKETLIHRLNANSAAKLFKTPSNAIQSFTVQTLERRSNSSNTWNHKCCSENSEMVIYLYICQDGPGHAKYILGRCGCAKEVLKGWAVKSASMKGKLLHFWIADNNYKWTNYPCEFKAEFDSLDDAHDFIEEFDCIMVQNAHIEEPSDDEGFIYQSQQL